MAIDKHVAGDTLNFFDVVPEFPASDGWTLIYRLNAMFTTPVQAQIVLTATTYQTTDYQVQASPATTALWEPGTYSWTREVRKSGARETLERDGNAKAPLAAFIEILPNPETRAQGYDPRSPARIALDAANAALATYGSTAFSHVAEYTIGNRSMRFREFRDQGDFIVWYSNLKAMVDREEIEAKLAAGLPNPRNIGVRFVRL